MRAVSLLTQCDSPPFPESCVIYQINSPWNSCLWLIGIQSASSRNLFLQNK
jgi:hypothetical protein